MKIYGIVGAGGFGREVIPMVKKMMINSVVNSELVFIDDNDDLKIVNGYRVISKEEFFSSNFEKKLFNIAIGNSQIREKIADEFISEGAKPFTVTYDNTVILDNSNIEDSSILCPFVTITSNAKIGKFFHANTYSYVAHDCVIGDYVTFGPSVKCNGGVIIEDHAYIGAGAVIKQGTPKRPVIIGQGAIIGMGSVVTKSVPSGFTVFGNPAKPSGKK
ncbi:acetyltransferase [Candidatus Williamhamiltonella defendens]|uniref:acetyltransferase n=1 Tax=Candidatus Williamhamiltonella defendens TaxID=138072 RepID=UPI00130E606B|nr:acetyltransferase [Candidatus Hamiltonella defensa]